MYWSRASIVILNRYSSQLKNNRLERYAEVLGGWQVIPSPPLPLSVSHPVSEIGAVLDLKIGAALNSRIVTALNLRTNTLQKHAVVLRRDRT